MELTDKHLEKIREAARSVRFGSVTINISETSGKLDLCINSRIWEDDEPAVDKSRKKKVVVRST